MNAKALGRFVAEFLEGFTGEEGSTGNAEAVQPTVVPVEAIREAVVPVVQQMVGEIIQKAMEAEDGQEEPAPSPQQLDMMFRDAGRAGDGRDEIAEMTLRRVHDIQEAEAKREAAARNGGAVPESYDPNDPGSMKPWQTPTV